jgi:ABC-type antimicrobial peptide transport system permease subunit
LHRAVVLTTEVDVCMFGRTVHPASLAYAALLSLGFAALANLLMNRSLRSIDMVEATKSAE